MKLKGEIEMSKDKRRRKYAGESTIAEFLERVNRVYKTDFGAKELLMVEKDLVSGKYDKYGIVRLFLQEFLYDKRAEEGKWAITPTKEIIEMIFLSNQPAVKISNTLIRSMNIPAGKDLFDLHKKYREIAGDINPPPIPNIQIPPLNTECIAGISKRALNHISIPFSPAVHSVSNNPNKPMFINVLKDRRLDSEISEVGSKWEVKARIEKFDNESIFALVLYNEAEDIYDMMERQYGSIHQPYDGDILDSIEVGDFVSSSDLYMDINNKSNEVEIKHWTKTNVIRIPLNNGDIMLNLYGTGYEYKPFPDLNEEMNHKIICATRDVTNVNTFHTMYNEQLSTIQGGDDSYYTDRGVIKDINIYSSRPYPFPESIYFEQINHYNKSISTYNDLVKYWVDVILNSSSRHTSNVSAIYEKFNKFTKCISRMGEIEFIIESEMTTPMPNLPGYEISKVTNKKMVKADVELPTAINLLGIVGLIEISGDDVLAYMDASSNLRRVTYQSKTGETRTFSASLNKIISADGMSMAEYLSIYGEETSVSTADKIIIYSEFVSTLHGGSPIRQESNIRSYVELMKQKLCLIHPNAGNYYDITTHSILESIVQYRSLIHSESSKELEDINDTVIMLHGNSKDSFINSITLEKDDIMHIHYNGKVYHFEGRIQDIVAINGAYYENDELGKIIDGELKDLLLWNQFGVLTSVILRVVPDNTQEIHSVRTIGYLTEAGSDIPQSVDIVINKSTL